MVSPVDGVQLGVGLVVHERTVEVPDLDAIVDSQPWRSCSRQNKPPVGGPFAHGSVGCLEGDHFGELVLSVEDVDVAGQISKTCNKDVLGVWRIQDGIPWRLGQGVDRVTSRIKEGCHGGHIAVDDGKLSRRWRPGDFMDGALVREVDLLVEQTRYVQKIELGLTIVGLVRRVDVCGDQRQDGGSERVPFESARFSLEELFLGDWRFCIW